MCHYKLSKPNSKVGNKSLEEGINVFDANVIESDPICLKAIRCKQQCNYFIFNRSGSKLKYIKSSKSLLGLIAMKVNSYHL